MVNRRFLLKIPHVLAYVGFFCTFETLNANFFFVYPLYLGVFRFFRSKMHFSLAYLKKNL